MEIVYYEYYPHYSGTSTGRIVVDIFALLLAQEILKDAKATSGEDDYYDLVDDLGMDFGKLTKKTLYFINEGLTNDFELSSDVAVAIKKIMDSVKRKGYYHGLSEEGSWYWALPEFEKKAQKALKKYEKDQMGDDDFDFED